MEELSEQISILLPLFSSLISSIVVFIATHLFYQSKLRKENKAVGAKLISDQIMESLVSVRKFANQLRVYENISVTTPEPDTDYEINPDRLNYQPIFKTEEDLFEFQNQLSELAATHQNNLDYKSLAFLIAMEKYLLLILQYLPITKPDDIKVIGTMLEGDITRWNKGFDKHLVRRINRAPYKLNSFTGWKWKYTLNRISKLYVNKSSLGKSLKSLKEKTKEQ